MERNPTLTDFIPVNIAFKLQELGSQVDQNEDEIGDIAVFLADRLTVPAQTGNKRILVNPITEDLYNITKLWQAIGDECGKTGDTIRGWERYCRHFTKDLRSRYDMFNRSQRKFIVDKAKADREAMIEIAESWLEESVGGNVGSYAGMVSWWKVKKGGPPQWDGWCKSAKRACEKLADYQPEPDQEGPPDSYVHAARDFIQSVEPRNPRSLETRS